MNFHNFHLQHVDAPRQWPLHSRASPSSTRENDSESTIRPGHHQQGDLERSPAPHESPSPQPTVVLPRPSPRSSSGPSPELYGSDPHFSPAAALQPTWDRHGGSPLPSAVVRFNEAQLAMAEAGNASRLTGFKDELASACGKVTPGVDDTPYIQYALEALTRDRGSSSTQQTWSSSSQRPRYNFAAPRRAYDEGFAFAAVAQPAQAHADTQPFEAGARLLDPATVMTDKTTAPEEPLASPMLHAAKLNQWIAVDKNTLQTIDPRGRTYPPLTFKPRILRPFSMMTLMILCLLMMTAFIFSDRFSDRHGGLTPYPGSIYSGQYFVFRILPQLLAAVVLLYAQSIVTASLRVLPFTMMSREDPRERYLALFQSLYPKSFLRPQLVGPWQMMVFDLATWLGAFTIPLQSGAFTCIYVHDEWMWAPSHGVVWTLVGLYALLAVATAALMVFWFGQWTGLRWDVGSIAHVIPLLSRTNTLGSYTGRARLAQATEFKSELRDRWFDRLGYWQTDMATGGIWHAIGTSALPRDHGPGVDEERVKRGSYEESMGSQDMTNLGLGGRGGHLPWCLGDGPLVGFVAVTGALVLALLVVSFLPQTRLDGGFMPRLTAKPSQGGFSAANFVYSFVPALVGMVLFLLFQSLDLALRIVQPWGALARAAGATARRSMLADYAACLPLQATWRALGNGHWRVAVTSLMALVFVLIPMLAGGLLMALTTADDEVRMFPSMPVFGVLVALLFLYVGSLSLLVPRRRQFLLPHAVTSVAGMVSLCSGADLVRDEAFRAVRSHGDLEARLGVGRDDGGEESIWFLGILAGRDEQRLSVRRMRRYTEKGMRGATTAV